MFKARQNNKRAVETFLVNNNSGNAAVLKNAADSTDPLWTTAGNVDLLNGEIGIVDGSGMGTATMHTFTTATPDIAESPVIYFAQGTGQSADVQNAQFNATHPKGAEPVIVSPMIKASDRVLVTKQAYQAPTTSIWTIGQPDGTTGEIAVTDNTEYSMRIAYRGRRQDEYYAPEATNFFAPSFTTPDYTTLGTAEPRDHLIQNLCWNINRNSVLLNVNRTRFRGNELVVALAIDSTGAAGDNIGGKGVAATHIAAGDVVPVVNTNLGIRNITLTADQAESIKNAAVAASGDAIADVTWSILTIDLATAGTVTGGVADVIMLLAVDEPLAFGDRIPQRKVRLDVGLTAGFDYNTVTHAQREEAFEGSGTGRVWNILYSNTHAQRKYNLRQRSEWPFMDGGSDSGGLDTSTVGSSPIVDTTNYVSYIIENVESNQIDTSNISESPQKTVILIPSTETTCIASIDAALASWLASANMPAVQTL